MPNEYKVTFSYLRNGDGKRVYENDFSYHHRAADAADEARDYYGDLPGFRIERVYIDAGSAWEEREFDY